MKSGIYRIINKVNGKYYIGSSVDIEKRYNRHINELRKGTHHSILLQRAYDKYGEVEFELEILEIINNTDLIKVREQEILDTSDYSILYNVSKSATGGDLISNHPNIEQIRENKRKLMKARLSKMNDRQRVETFARKLDNNGMFNRTHSQESRAKIRNKLVHRSSYRKGKTFDELFGYNEANRLRDNLSNHASKRVGDKNPFYGKHHTEETKKKLSESAKGRPNMSEWEPVIIDRVEYESMQQASEKLGIPVSTIYYRINSKNSKFTSYRYKDKSKNKVMNQPLVDFWI